MTIDDWRARYDHLNAETDRLRAEVKRLRARLAAVEAERDAARAKRDAARAEVAHMKREQQAMIMQHRHDIRDLGQLLQDERCKVATIEAAWYAARAGEARAVEALKRIRDGAEVDISDLTGENEAHKLCSYCGQSNDHTDDCPHSICVEALADTPTLAWLAQQRAEAAAEALLGLKDSIRGGTYRPHVAWRCISTRAAALRAGATGGADA